MLHRAFDLDWFFGIKEEEINNICSMYGRDGKCITLVWKPEMKKSWDT